MLTRSDVWYASCHPPQDARKCLFYLFALKSVVLCIHQLPVYQLVLPFNSHSSHPTVRSSAHQQFISFTGHSLTPSTSHTAQHSSYLPVSLLISHSASLSTSRPTCQLVHSPNQSVRSLTRLPERTHPSHCPCQSPATAREPTRLNTIESGWKLDGRASISLNSSVDPTHFPPLCKASYLCSDDTKENRYKKGVYSTSVTVYQKGTAKIGNSRL